MVSKHEDSNTDIPSRWSSRIWIIRCHLAAALGAGRSWAELGGPNRRVVVIARNNLGWCLISCLQFERLMRSFICRNKLWFAGLCTCGVRYYVILY